MTPANLLTALRLAATAPMAWSVSREMWWPATLIFAAAVASDVFDGRVARARGEASAAGGLFDHTTDATFVATSLGAMAAAGFVPWLLPTLIAASFAQYLLDSRALRGAPLRGSTLGRFNGIAYFALLGTLTIANLLPPLGALLPYGHTAAYALCASTAVSMYLRARHGLHP